MVLEVVVAASTLFEELPEQVLPAREGAGGRPRLREPVRDQIELRAVDLDSLIGEDHPARLIWAYAERLDLGELEARIKAREGMAGHPPISPRLMLALWLYATSQGVGSARALAGLCTSHDAYRWLCGGVSVNHHTLGDFRVSHPALLDRLMVDHVAALAAAGVIDLATLAQDGMRVRAGAGAASFRRRPTLERCRAEAQALVERLKRERDDDPDAGGRRIRAARERAAHQRVARVEAALQALGETEAQRQRREQSRGRKQSGYRNGTSQKSDGRNKDDSNDSKPGGGDTDAGPPAVEAVAPADGKDAVAPADGREAAAPGAAAGSGEAVSGGTARRREPRASTTDAEARVMKMADGGFRPAYNLQIVSAPEEQIVITVEALTTGSDRGLLRPQLEAVEARYGHRPAHYLADGGFTRNEDIEWAHQAGTAVCCPPVKTKHRTDPFAPRKGDGPGVAAWRARMTSDEGKERYKRRAIAEVVHARFRHWGLTRLTVRGRQKARAVLLWFALANNILRGHALTSAATPA